MSDLEHRVQALEGIAHTQCDLNTEFIALTTRLREEQARHRQCLRLQTALLVVLTGLSLALLGAVVLPAFVPWSGVTP